MNPVKAPKQLAASQQAHSLALQDHPAKLFVEITTRCNMKCRMCVKQTMGSGLTEGDLTMPTFKAIEPMLCNIRALILNGIGEPLLHPQLEEFIRVAKRLMPDDGWVGFQTNGLLLNEQRAISLVEAGTDRICLSLDSIRPDTFKKIREGGEVKDMEKAFKALERARNLNPSSSLQIGVEFVVMRDNVHQLPDVLRWSAARGASFAIVTNLLSYDDKHVSQVAYDSNTDQALEIFQAWQSKGMGNGLDLQCYFKALWKRPRTPEEQKVVDFVQAMLADARSRDVFLHLDNLLKRDLVLAEETSRVFAAAKAVAEVTGMDLTLPRMTATNERKCRFIDDGAMFISWDGRVHSCYFLWHKFQCHFSGRKKYVDPKTFGDLSEKGIHAIWNTRTYRAFRKEVLEYEYPVCSNCNLLPCEYLYTEDFEQDCFTSTVPCGDCLWCMGLFQCLS